MNLREQLEKALQGRICLMGLGSPDYGDDCLGVVLADELVRAGVPDVIVAGANPDRYLSVATDQKLDHVVFLDAVEIGGEPGSVVFLNTAEIRERFPQISTHKLSLGTMASFIESNGRTKAWVLGVQPESIRQGRRLSPNVRATLNVLRELLACLKDGSLC